MAVKKIFYGPEGIMIRHVLMRYDKESLLDYAKDLDIKRISRLKKDELAEKIADELLTPSVMRRRIATFSPECRKLFERAIKGVFVPSSYEMDDALSLYESDYAFLDESDRLIVPVDVKKAYEKINTPEFREYARKMSWLSQCLEFGEIFYGVFNKDILLEMYNGRKGFYISKGELEKLCDEFPEDMTECCMEKGKELIISEYLLYDGSYENLLDIQAGKDFYIPDYQEILDYSKNLYLSHEPAYQKYREFLQSEIGMTYEEADEEALTVWDKIQVDMDLSDMVLRLIDVYEDLLDETKLEEFVQIFQDLNNNTRMQIHRGHTPIEMIKMQMKQGDFSKRPVIVPGSTEAAELLKGASEVLEEMGIHVDLDSNASMFSDNSVQRDVSGQANDSLRKVYPNDPCPCGSGKKFKKCCGKYNKL